MTSAYGGGHWQGKEGSRYDLYYDPANPEKIQLLDFSGVLFWTTFFSCLGAVCLTIGAWKTWFIHHFPA